MKDADTDTTWQTLSLATGRLLLKELDHEKTDTADCERHCEANADDNEGAKIAVGEKI